MLKRNLFHTVNLRKLVDIFKHKVQHVIQNNAKV